jgi:hypothetical protein
MAYGDSVLVEDTDQNAAGPAGDDDTDASADLPSFLTDDRHAAHALNGAAAD